MPTDTLHLIRQKPIRPRNQRRGARVYAVDRAGFPRMTRLELLRVRRFVTLVAAARTIGCATKSLLSWECGGRCSRAETRLAIERLFGHSWPSLMRDAPYLGIPKGDPT